jgi:hypothetical protein
MINYKEWAQAVLNALERNLSDSIKLYQEGIELALLQLLKDKYNKIK